MGNSLRLGKVLGITIRLHYSWFLIFILISFFLSLNFLEGHPHWVRVMAGIGASLSLFASVVAHELAHSFVAIKSGIPVKSITLFILGGVAHITREATRPMTELRMAIAGPLCSLILAGIFGLLWFLIWGSTQDSLDFDNPDSLIAWIAWINFTLALFNLAPGFPLDGGRILRALLWQRTGNYRQSTRIAFLIGKGIAILLIGGGVVVLFCSIFTEIIDDPILGVWLIFIGWFLHTIANTSYRQVEMREVLRGLTAQAVMNTDYIAIPPYLSLRELIQDYILSSGRDYFVVTEAGRLKGIVTLENVKAVPQQDWGITPVSAVMTPEDKVVTAHPGEEAISLLDRMDGYDISQIPVVRDGAVLGVILRQNLLRFMRLRSEVRV